MSQRNVTIPPSARRAIRLQLGLAQSQLASYLGIPQPYLCDMESGKRGFCSRRIYYFYRKLIHLTPHLLARRSQPDWDL